MEWNYLLGALGLSTVFYGLGWIFVNSFRKEGSPKIYFLSSLQQLFTDRQLKGIKRYFLLEKLLSVVLLYTFSTLILYKAWSSTGPMDINQPSHLPFSALLLLSFICSLPLMYLSKYVIALASLFSGDIGDILDVHWLEWILNRFEKTEEKAGCLRSVLTLVEFVVLSIYFGFTFLFCFVILSLAFTL